MGGEREYVRTLRELPQPDEIPISDQNGCWDYK